MVGMIGGGSSRRNGVAGRGAPVDEVRGLHQLHEAHTRAVRIASGRACNRQGRLTRHRRLQRVCVAFALQDVIVPLVVRVAFEAECVLPPRNIMAPSSGAILYGRPCTR
jgi:hypothetical protein